MDVLCVGMYRSCSTWQYEVAAHLLERHRGGLRLGYLTGEQYDARKLAEADDDGWRVLKSHEGHPRFAQTLAEGSAVALYAYRDLREVIYSMLHKRGVDFATFLSGGMIHQLLANDREWFTQPGVLHQRYEDLVADPASGVAQIAEHLGIALEPGEAERVAQSYSAQANRKRIAALGQRLRADGVDLGDPTNAQLYDSTTLLHWNHMREEQAPRWRDLATPSEIVALDRLCSAWLIERGYEPDRSWTALAARNDANASSLAERVHARTVTVQQMAHGWLSCQLRCASLRHPRTAQTVKSLLPVPPSPRKPAARPYQPAPLPQVDAA